MRELKFRAWDSYHKEFIFDAQATYDNQCRGKGSIHHESFQEVLEDENCIVEQYTGLKDKNGRMVYEGDILKFEDSIFEIGWLNKSARFGFCPIKKCNIGMSFSLSRSEVIGNIHENPELLEAKQ